MNDHMILGKQGGEAGSLGPLCFAGPSSHSLWDPGLFSTIWFQEMPVIP